MVSMNLMGTIEILDTNYLHETLKAKIFNDQNCRETNGTHGVRSCLLLFSHYTAWGQVLPFAILAC